MITRRAEGGEETEVPEKLQKNVRSVLLSSLKGVQLKKFCSEYRSLVKEPFPWRLLGYSSVVSLLKAMPNVVRFEFSTKHDDYCLYGIVDNNCYLPSWLKKSQEKNRLSIPPPLSYQLCPKRGASPKKSSSPRKQASPTKGSQGHKNGKNLVTVHVSFKHGDTPATDDTASTLAMMKKQLPEVMKACGVPRSTYISGKGFAFVRYATLTEAERAIKFSGKFIGKTCLVINPAKESEQLFSKSSSKSVTARAGKSEGAILMCGEKERESKGGSRPVTLGSISWSDACDSSSKPSRDGQHPPLTQSTRASERTHEAGAGLECSCAVPSFYCPPPPDDVTRKSCDYHECRAVSPGSDSQSDLDSEFWDEELLTSSPFSTDSNAEHVPAPYRAVSVPPLDLETESCSSQLSQRNTPVDNGLTLVHVSLVESPDLVWLQLTSDPERDVAKLSEWIAHLRPPRLTRVAEGQICCVGMASGGYWRVQVDQFDNCVTRQQASVLFIDTGQSQTVPCARLHSLPPSLSLSSVPPLAMPCRLGGIRSTFAGGEWYFLDNQLLWKYLMKKKVYVRKNCLPFSSPVTHAHLPQVVVDVFLDAEGKNSVASLLVSTGMHVVWDDTYRAASESSPTVTQTLGSRSTIGEQTVAMKCGVKEEVKTGFQMVSRTVRITHVGEFKPPLPLQAESSDSHEIPDSTLQRVPRVCENGSGVFTTAALLGMEEGMVERPAQVTNSQDHSPGPVSPRAVSHTPMSNSLTSNHPLHSCHIRQLLPASSSSFSPPPSITTSPSPLVHSVTQSHHHNSPPPSSHKTSCSNSPFLRLQKLLHSIQTDTSC